MGSLKETEKKERQCEIDLTEADFFFHIDTHRGEILAYQLTVNQIVRCSQNVAEFNNRLLPANFLYYLYWIFISFKF